MGQGRKYGADVSYINREGFVIKGEADQVEPGKGVKGQYWGCRSYINREGFAIKGEADQAEPGKEIKRGYRGMQERRRGVSVEVYGWP